MSTDTKLITGYYLRSRLVRLLTVVHETGRIPRVGETLFIAYHSEPAAVTKTRQSPARVLDVVKMGTGRVCLRMGIGDDKVTAVVWPARPPHRPFWRVTDIIERPLTREDRPAVTRIRLKQRRR